MLVVPGTRSSLSVVEGAAICGGGRDVLVAFAFIIIFSVYKENTFTSATIDVYGGQTVISTGPRARSPSHVCGWLLDVLGDVSGARLIVGPARPRPYDARAHLETAR